VASLVCACAGFLFIVPGVLGVIFGFIARSQIRQSRGTQGGDGLALAGIIVGFAWIGLFLILVIVGAASNNSSGVVLGLNA
jgi:predicted acyltransferase